MSTNSNIYAIFIFRDNILSVVVTKFPAAIFAAIVALVKLLAELIAAELIILLNIINQSFHSSVFFCQRFFSFYSFFHHCILTLL